MTHHGSNSNILCIYLSHDGTMLVFFMEHQVVLITRTARVSLNQTNFGSGGQSSQRMRVARYGSDIDVWNLARRGDQVTLFHSRCSNLPSQLVFVTRQSDHGFAHWVVMKADDLFNKVNVFLWPILGQTLPVDPAMFLLAATTHSANDLTTCDWITATKLRYGQLPDGVLPILRI